MEFQAQIIRAIQSVASPALDVIFQCITVMGEELFLLPVAVLLFWCVNKELGYWICWCAAEGNLLVNSVKGIFKVERPIGYDGIRTLRAKTATGYSFPSGHTQACANLFTALATANAFGFWRLFCRFSSESRACISAVTGRWMLRFHTLWESAFRLFYGFFTENLLTAKPCCF